MKKRFSIRFLSLLLAAALTLGLSPLALAQGIDPAVDIRAEVAGIYVDFDGSEISVTVPYDYPESFKMDHLQVVPKDPGSYSAEITPGDIELTDWVTEGTVTVTFTAKAGADLTETEAEFAITITREALDESISQTLVTPGAVGLDKDSLAVFPEEGYFTLAGSAAAMRIVSGYTEEDIADVENLAELLFYMKTMRSATYEYTFTLYSDDAAKDKIGTVVFTLSVEEAEVEDIETVIVGGSGAEAEVAIKDIVKAIQSGDIPGGSFVPASITFTDLPSSSRGTLTYGRDEVAEGDAIDIADIESVVFEPSRTFAGSVSVLYEISDEDGYTFGGKLVFKVLDSEADDIELTTVYTKKNPVPVEITLDMIQEACGYTDDSAEVTITKVSGSAGDLFEDKAGKDDITVTSSRPYTMTDSVWMIPDRTGTLTVSYEAETEQGTFEGVIKITASSPEAEDLHYILTSSSGKYYLADDADFFASVEDALRELYGDNSLDLYKVTFTDLPSSSRGTLYCGSSKDPVTSRNDEFYYDDFEDLYYVPDDYGSGTFSYQAETEDEDVYIVGNVTLTVIGKATINLAAEPGDDVYMNADDFENACESAVGEDAVLEYVRFYSASNGKMYYDDDTISSGTRFYPSGKTNPIDAVYFTPKAGFIGRASVEFTATATLDDRTVSFDGIVYITLTGESINYQVSQNGTVTFDEGDFVDFFEEAYPRQTLSYVEFTDGQPSSGKLYYNYRASASSNTNVTSSMNFYYNPSTSSRYNLNNVTFVPSSSAGYNYTVSIPFTAYGSGSGEVSGLITIRVVKSGAANITYSCSGTGVTFNGTTFRDRCISSIGGTLDYVQFDLPDASKGTLYYNYSSAVNHGSKVTETAKYSLSSSPYLSYIRFVPRAGFSGTVEIPYTAYNTTGTWFTGTVVITVSPKTASSTFADVNRSSYSWAADSVDFLYSNSVTNGTDRTHFSPASNMTRGDFMLMLYRAFSLNSVKGASTASNFADVPSGSYYATAIAVAKSLGIATGDGVNFHPDAAITRQEAFTLIYRTMQKVGWSLSNTTGTSITSFKDYGSIASWASTAMTSMVRAGVLIGDNGYLNPAKNISRAEMAVTLHRVLTY